MQLILNEKKFAERIIKKGIVGDKPSFTLRLLARYYYHILLLQEKDIEKALHRFMNNNYKNYNSALWENNIEKYAKQANKINIRILNNVKITENEMEFIKQIDNEKYQKLVFVMLCYCKFYNAISDKNNNWVNVPINDIFKSARVNLRYSIDKMKMMHDLREYLNKRCEIVYDSKGKDITQYIMVFTKKCNSHNVQLNIVDDRSKAVLKISDFRELGYEYLKYLGGNYARCRQCGILFKQNKNNTLKYCCKHRGYQSLNTKTVKCIDCGEEFEVDARNMTKTRCDDCYEIYRRKYDKLKKQEKRAKLKNLSTDVL